MCAFYAPFRNKNQVSPAYYAGMNALSHIAEHRIKMIREDLSPLGPFLENPRVTEIMINRPDAVFVEEGGEMNLVDIKFKPEDIQKLITAIGRRMRTDPSRENEDAIVDADLDSLRFSAIYNPISVDSDCITIRKHAPVNYSLSQLEEMGGFDPILRTPLQMNPVEPAPNERPSEFLHRVVANRYTTLFSGMTGSAKTTFIKACLQAVPSEERVISAEDVLELVVPHVNRIRLLTSKPTAKNGGVSMRRLLKAMLRSRPDRIIVGEVRDGAAYDMLDAWASGHPGIGSMHASSGLGALHRLESMIMEGVPADSSLPLFSIRQKIAQSVNFVVHCTRKDGRRGLAELIRVDGIDEAGHYQFTRIY
jgi:pilus assembly protein CpaF